MLHIKIVCVGKIKKRFYSDACNEYAKRLKRFAKLSIIEVVDEKAPESLSSAEIAQTKEIEGQRILQRINSDDFVIALSISGKIYDSVVWAKHISDLMSRGKGHFCFIIGGSNGLSPSVLQRADEHLSFSSFTFCHQLMRVILLEQIYRCMKICANEAYHK